MFERVIKVVDQQELVVLRERLFRVETGQKRVTWEQYQALKTKTEELEAFWLRFWEGINGNTHEKEVELHNRTHTLDQMEAMLKRHLELHPGDQEMELFAAAMSSAKRNNRTIDRELFDRFMQKLIYLFADCPQPPQPSGLFKRYFGS
jgi:hypothetical protein